MADLWVQLTTAKVLIDACVRARVDGLDATDRITMAKIHCFRVASAVADQCVQLHGGFGFMKESMAGRAYVDTRVGTIGGGSEETMLHYLAKYLGF